MKKTSYDSSNREKIIQVKKVKTDETKKKTDSKAWLWILVIGVLVVIGAATIKFPYTGMVTYTDTVPINKVETYQDTEAYTDKECNQVSIKKNIDWGATKRPCLQQECAEHYQVCVDKNFWGNCVRYEDRCRSYRCVKTRLDCSLNIKNIDDEGGTFKFEGYVINTDNGDESYIKDVSVYVRAQDTGTGYWSYVYIYPSSYNCRYKDFENAKKTVCENVIKYRTVTKERTVVGEEEVQKQREEVKYHTLFEALGWV